MLQDILTSILTSGIITGIFVFIINKAIETQFDMKLKSYENELKAKSDKELLQLTKNLELKASERNIKLTSIFEKQAETILTTYKKLYVLQVSMAKFIGSRIEREDSKRRAATEDLGEKWRELSNYYNENKVLIEITTVEKLETLENLYANLFGGHLMLSVKEERRLTDEEITQRMERRRELENIEKEINEVKIKLEADFRDILGISISKIIGEPK